MELDLNAVSPGAADFQELLRHKTGLNLAECCQCGKCSAGCPMAPYMDVMPRQIVRYVQLGQLGTAFSAQAPWLCVACHACSSRCPHQVDLPALMDCLRREAARQGHVAVKEVDLFTRLFMSTVRIFGRSHEIFLSACFNLFSLHFLQDLLYAPRLYVKGKIHILPQRIQGRAALRRLIAPAAVKLHFQPLVQLKAIFFKRGDKA